jgi:hypothetical protein
MSHIQLKDLYTIAGGLNIEGGFPKRDLPKKSSLWVNLVLVLDRPLIDNIVFDDIFKNNKYPLLENAIEEINEKHFMMAYVLILAYYIDNCKKLLNQDHANILIYVHQDTHSVALIDLLKNYIKDITAYFKTDMSNINISYKTDTGSYATTNDNNFKDIDLLISLSQCAGLDPKLGPGALIVPNKFIPYDIDTNTIQLNKTYTVDNHLVNELQTIVKSTYNFYAMSYINSNYMSYNKNKNGTDPIIKLHEKDFYRTPILQVNKLWNPTNDSEKVEIQNA